MRVRMRTTLAGPMGTARAGESIDVEDKLGAALIAGNYAEELPGEPEVKSEPAPVETATEPEPEEEAATVSSRRGGRYGRKSQSRK